MINIQRRKRVMSRSIKLGHCVCDPAKPCPCDLFRQKDICLCAGERLEEPTQPVPLTKLVESAGCASKIDQAFLKEVLKDLPELNDPRVLVGVPAGDDAGIYDLGDGMALVQTVDVFTPSVDDPYLFGQVAAANSLSDIYAMGAKPLTALSIIGFPVRKVPDKTMFEILRGGVDKMKEAGVPIIGGHSINDSQIKAGFAVTGFMATDKIVTNAAAAVGDILILTKPLGTGIVAFAGQIDRAAPQSLAAAAASMTALNKTAAQLMVRFGAHACTDITGFGLMGHLTELAFRSGVDVEIIWDDLPWLPGVLDYVAQGILPGAIERNRESCARMVVPSPDLSEPMVDMCYDAQTSGGLLIAIEKEKSLQLLHALHQNGISDAAIIGRVIAKGTGKVFMKTNKKQKLPQDKPNSAKPPASCCGDAASSSCCGNAASSCCPPETPRASVGSEQTSQSTADMQAKFGDFVASANKPGALDAYTRQAINIALSVATRCQPCLKTHIEKAKKMGFSREEIDEAAWLAVAFGAGSVMMFYKQNMP